MADCRFRNYDRNRNENYEENIEHYEDRAAVFGGNVRKSPNIAESCRRANRGKNKAAPQSPGFPLSPAPRHLPSRLHRPRRATPAAIEGPNIRQYTCPDSGTRDLNFFVRFTIF